MLESPYGRRRSSHPLPALRDGNGHARPRARHAVDARSVLDLSKVRPSFLVNLFDACRGAGPGETETGDRAGFLTIS